MRRKSLALVLFAAVITARLLITIQINGGLV